MYLPIRLCALLSFRPAPARQLAVLLCGQNAIHKTNAKQIRKMSLTCSNSIFQALAETLLETDTGYQRLMKLYANSVLPKKRSKRHMLTKQQRRENREISQKRSVVEYAIRFVKRFRILSECYRNRRKHFALRFSDCRYLQF